MDKKEFIKLKVKNILIKTLEERGINVDKIVIFGSFAKAEMKKDSDIDIIIISRNFRGKTIFERVRLATGIGRELVRQIKLPVDLIYYSDEEWKTKSFLIINEAKAYGEVLYG